MENKNCVEMEQYVENMISWSINITMWLLNMNTYEIFKKSKKDAKKEELDFYKNISDVFMMDDDWVIEIDFKYKNCKFNLSLDFDGNILSCYVK